MDAHRSVTGTIWDCKYHAVFIRKCGRKALHVELHRHLPAAFRNLATKKERRVEEGHLMSFSAALSGSSTKAPGFAGGYLLWFSLANAMMEPATKGDGICETPH